MFNILPPNPFRTIAALVLISSSAFSQEPTRFTLLDNAATNVHFNNTIKDSNEANILIYANFYGGAGVGVGDFNNDGLQDLYFAGNIVPDKLYLNQGNMVFEDATERSGIKQDGGWSTGVTVADINNDGFLDIYVSRELHDKKPEWRTNLLYINNGNGTFSESAKAFGVDNSERTRHSTFLDYDNDGFLDLFLLTQPPNPGSYSEFFGTDLKSKEYHLKLLKNTGNGSFVDVSQSAGIDLTGFPNGVCASDINNDGYTDIYVANDFDAPDFLFQNNRDGTFTNIADAAIKHTSYYSMGVDIADINNDALLDIFVVDMVAEDNFRLKSNMSGMNPDSFWKVVDEGGGYQYMYNTVQLNNGNSTFSDIAQFTGMAATDWSWSNLIADFDNDGLKDTYVTNGLLYDIRNTDADKNVASLVNKTTYDYLQNNPDGGNLNSIWDILNIDEVIALLPSQPLKNYAFQNKGNLNFENKRSEWGLDQESFSNGAAYADFDNDGDLDIVVNNINQEAFIYRNNSERMENANYLRVRLVDEGNKPVLGSKVTLHTSKGIQYQETTNVRGIYSTSEQLVHFGLGNIDQVDSLTINWPNGKTTVQRNIEPNQTLAFDMNDASKDQKVKQRDTIITDSFFEEITESYPLQYAHSENDFDDFEKQVLLPHKLSQFGPALAVGDFNGDGLEDVFIGGAHGYAATLAIQGANGDFKPSNEDLWQKEKEFEDVDAVFIDVNGDGYQDLYVVSGGNEFVNNDLRYNDRLYINDKSGNFTRDTTLGVLPISGSKVSAQDYDGDGDVDLFVGGRHVPNEYPLPATSMLLKNENGILKNLTNELAPEFENLGMVTDATWADYDGDTDFDLIITGEWMNLTVFENENGELKSKTETGLENTSGWWFSIEKGDFDNDGDVDFIAGNLGLNYKYKTSPEAPFDIYYNDFDKNGESDIVLGYYNKDKHFPLRGFSCSSEQIPGLKDKIQKYDLFASMELEEVYGKKGLENSLHLTTDSFASSFIENMGNGSFKIRELPNLAQLSNINDLLVNDFNNDSFLDVLVVGNLYASEIETPRSDAGTGLLLLGDGKGNFEPITAMKSGFYASGDAKQIRVLSKGEAKVILVANNNNTLQIFDIKTKTATNKKSR
ncbi:MAG TPA: hypothetical protein ENH87_12365 [Pricia antarctica]|uniref:ASPIC/UnbV domain-containing protein n=2 Tax=root TaxID=1 RepID=A0A831QQZ3_9FLAO|nr:hypothetical protein [Pricia antarctica]